MKHSVWLFIAGLAFFCSPVVFSQADWEPLFFDDFEEGITESWSLEPGIYPLFATVSDGDTAVVVQWIVEIREKSATAVESSEQTNSGEMIRIRPNPFSDMVEIHYRLPYPAGVTLEVYDLSGRKAFRRYKGIQGEGRHSLVWDGAGTGHAILPEGVYIARFIYQGAEEVLVQERKLIISR